MNELMSAAWVATFFGITIGLAIVVATARRAAQRVLRRRWQAKRTPVRRRGRASRRRGAAGSTPRTRRYW
jgi:hypothetical protein